MRIFVTGASGFIGSAIVQDLLRGGHDVIGLARSGASAQILTALGVKVHRGDLEDLDSLQRGAFESDGVIHTAFIHDMSKFKETCEIDRHAIEAIGSALSGSRRRFVVATGMTAIPSGRLSTEQDPSIPSSDFPRAATDEAVQAVLSSGVNASLVRLPPMVHDQTRHGIAMALVRIAKQTGVSAYVAGGANRWPAVHVLDAARLFKLVFEKGEAGARYHAVGEEGLSAKELAHAIGGKLDLPVTSIPASEAARHFGWVGRLAASDLSACSANTQKLLGWQPMQSGLLSDIEHATNF